MPSTWGIHWALGWSVWFIQLFVPLVITWNDRTFWRRRFSLMFGTIPLALIILRTESVSQLPILLFLIWVSQEFLTYLDTWTRSKIQRCYSLRSGGTTHFIYHGPKRFLFADAVHSQIIWVVHLFGTVLCLHYWYCLAAFLLYNLFWFTW